MSYSIDLWLTIHAHICIHEYIYIHTLTKYILSQMWGPTPIIPAFLGLMQKDNKFNSSLSYIASSPLSKKKKEGKKEMKYTFSHGDRKVK